MTDRISDLHRSRAAYVYIRQSTLQQVRHNLESSRRQYALQDRARELGFREVVLIDDDLGISGSGSRERPGFGRLLTAVCNGEAGAVFALEASRLARNNRDWHHLIDLCVLTGAVVVDADGVYDPRVLNDRLLLGLKGTMSEFELGILRQRAQEAYRQKVHRGEVLTRVPVGYVRSGPCGIEMTPDREVQESIRSVFQHFERLGTLRQVLLWHHHEKIPLPVVRVRGGMHELAWQMPNYQQLLRILKNPAYAGAFAYGRTRTLVQAAGDRPRKSQGHRVAQEDWQVLIKDHHAAYVSWDRYMENQRILASNRTKSHAASCGAAREGNALLAGLLRCARCGQKLRVAYRGRDGRAPRYYCMTGSKEQGKPSCHCFGALRVQQAVVEAVLGACGPLGAEASMQAFDAGLADQVQKRRILELAVERTGYESDLARRRYEAVDPGNRLVAAELEARWNAVLAQADEARSRLRSECESVTALTEMQRTRLLALGKNLRMAWDDPAAPVTLKKRILRTLIHEIIVDVNHATGQVEMRIHWAGGVHTELKVRKNKSGRNGQATDLEVVELVKELATAQSDSLIAATLNRMGCQTGPGNTWNQTRVKNLRRQNHIPVFVPGGDRSWITMAEAARELKTGVGVVRTMIKHGILPASQRASSAPWLIQKDDLQGKAVQNHLMSARRKAAVRREDKNQTLMTYE